MSPLELLKRALINKYRDLSKFTDFPTDKQQTYFYQKISVRFMSNAGLIQETG